MRATYTLLIGERKMTFTSREKAVKYARWRGPKNGMMGLVAEKGGMLVKEIHAIRNKRLRLVARWVEYMGAMVDAKGRNPEDVKGEIELAMFTQLFGKEGLEVLDEMAEKKIKEKEKNRQ